MSTSSINAMNVILRGSTENENVGDLLMSAVAQSMLIDLGVNHFYRLNHMGLALDSVKDLDKINVLFDLGNVHYCDTGLGSTLEDRLINSINFNRAIPNAKRVFLPASWGPYMTKHQSLLNELTKSSIVFGRDRYSVQNLNDLLQDERAELCPDLALLCERENANTGQQILNKLKISTNSPILGLIPNSRCIQTGVTPLNDTSQYYQHLRTAVNWGRKHNYQVVGISHMVGTTRDALLLKELGIPIFKSDQATEVRSVVANLDIAVCSRYHGIVNCLVHGVPVISLGWHTKYMGIMNLFDILDFDHMLDQNESLLRSRLDLLSERRSLLVARLEDRLRENQFMIRKSITSMSERIGGPSQIFYNKIIVKDDQTRNMVRGSSLMHRATLKVKKLFTKNSQLDYQ